MVRKKGVYEELGVTPVINAAGNMTLLGGSRPSPKVVAAMEEAGHSFVEMKGLLETSGEIIANIFGAEAAYVTPGCCAALALGAAACMAGGEADKMERLPDVTGMKSEILIQRRARVKYDRCVTVLGAKLIEVGDENGTTSEQIESAIGPATAAIQYLASADGSEGVVPLREVVPIGKKHSIPVIVDAAPQVYPLHLMLSYPRMGADLVCFGAKYFGAPNSTGILCGRRDLVESAAAQSFIGFESSPYRTVGRPLKVDRQEVIAVVVALQEWFSMDHEARAVDCEGKARTIVDGLQGLEGVNAYTAPERSGPARGLPCTVVRSRIPGKDAASLATLLREGNPRIWVRVEGDRISMATFTLMKDEEKAILKRLRSLLSG